MLFLFHCVLTNRLEHTDVPFLEHSTSLIHFLSARTTVGHRGDDFSLNSSFQTGERGEKREKKKKEWSVTRELATILSLLLSGGLEVPFTVSRKGGEVRG